MSHTDGKWTQALPSSGLQLFVGASEFVDVAGVATLASAGAGKLTLNLGAGAAGTFFANLAALQRRLLTYADANLDQQQFGTAASVPGPSAVAGTSGPSNFLPGYPPLTQANMATLGHMQNGPTPKGVQISSVELVTAILTADATVYTMGLTKTVFVDKVAPAVTNIVALGNNGLVKTFNAQPTRQKITVVTPAMITDDGAEVILNVNLTANAGGTAVFYGAILNLSYNFN